MRYALAVQTRFQRLAAIGLISLAFLHNTLIGWRKWGDLLIDCGKEWDVAAQLAGGQRLYVDNRYYYGPLTPYVNALLFRCFGIHVDVLMYAGLVVVAAMCVVMYRLSRCFLDRAPAALVTVGFLYLFALSQMYPGGICNYVLPYSPAASYGSLLSIACLYFLIKYARKLQPKYIWLASLFLALAGLTKMELFFAAAVAHAALFVGLWWTGVLRWRTHVLAVAAGLAAMGCVYAVVIHSVTWPVFADNVFGLFGPSYQQYSAELAGLLDLRHSLKMVAGSSAILLGAIVIALAAAFLARGSAERRDVRLGLFAAGLVIGGLAYKFCPINMATNCLPLLLAGGLLTVLVMAWKNPKRRAALLPFALLHVFALACLFRIALNCTIYGFPQFFLLPPALVVFALLWFVYLPDFNRLKLGAGLPFVSRGVGTGALLTLCALQLSYSSRAFELRTTLIDFPRARMFVTTGTKQFPAGEMTGSLNDWLCGLPRDARVLVLPYGVGFTFVAGLKTPYRLHSYLPTDLTGNYAEALVLEEWKANPPDYILRIPTPDNPALDGFGTRYGLLMRNWIQNNFEPLGAIGPDHYYLILKHK